MEPQELLKIADEITRKNPNIGLTGSLLLYAKGIKLDREPKDVDFVGAFKDKALWIPDGFYPSEYESQSESVVFQHITTGVKLDFMESTEALCYDDVDMRCADLQWLIYVKILYAKNDADATSRVKHFNDLTALREYMNDANKKHFDNLINL